ncbi:MAG: hypothetical protein FJ398_12095 [Verrucomicrobia bacterium]|nr:hypothetical protein [Verrucomicrobiota bacterium]
MSALRLHKFKARFVRGIFASIAPLLLLQYLAFLPVTAEVPTVNYVFPAGGKQGSTVEITVGGKLDPWPLSVCGDSPGLTFKTNEAKGKFTLEISTNAPIGPHLIRFYNAEGASATRCFVVGHLDEQLEKEPNDSPDKAQALEKLPIVLNGRLDKTDDSDSFAVRLEKGQWLVAWVDAYSLDSPVDPILQLRDRAGTKVAFNHDDRSLDPLLAYQAKETGMFVLQLAGFAYPPRAEVRLTGGEGAVYRLTVSSGPVARYAFPPRVVRGSKTSVRLFGWNLGQTGEALACEIDASAVNKHAIDFFPALPALENRPRIRIGALPEQLEIEPNNTTDLAQPLPCPAAISGRIDPPGDEDRFALTAKKGDKFLFRLESAQFGFPLDGVLRITDQSGKELSRSDDAGRSADPELHWTAPADGTFVIAVSDLIQRGGSDFVYHLEINEPKPSFNAVVEGNAFRLEPGKSVEVKATVSRLHGFAANLLVVADGLPDGVTSTTATVSSKGEATLKLSATDDAKPANQPFRVLAIAPDLDPPAIRTAAANLKGQNTAAGDLLINQTEKLWVTVLPAKPKTEDKPADQPKKE